MFDCLCPCCWRDHAQYFTTHTCTDTHTHRKLICWAANWVSCGCGKTTAWTGLLSSRFNHLHSFSVVLSILSLHLSSDHSSLSLSLPHFSVPTVYISPLFRFPASFSFPLLFLLLCFCYLLKGATGPKLGRHTLAPHPPKAHANPLPLHSPQSVKKKNTHKQSHAVVSCSYWMKERSGRRHFSHNPLQRLRLCSNQTAAAAVIVEVF